MQETTQYTLSLQVPAALKDAFIQAASEEKRPASQVVLALMQDYVRRAQANKPTDRAAMAVIVKQGNDTDRLIDVVIATDDPELRERAAQLLRKVAMTEEQKERIIHAAYDALNKCDQAMVGMLIGLIPVHAGFAMRLKQALGSDHMRALKVNYAETEATYGANWLE